MSTFKPMLASPADLDALTFPRFGSPKLDGIRASVVNSKLLSRSLKAIPNRFVRSLLERPELEGIDGELTVGPANSPTVYRDTVSGVMSQDGEPAFTFWVFDIHNMPDVGFHGRFYELRRRVEGHGQVRRIQLVDQHPIRDAAALEAYEAKIVGLGYEGVMLRAPDAPYKFGRSTPKEGYLLKVKRFIDSDVEVIGVVEEMHNANDAETNELGRTKRSSAKAGLVGKGTMGALHVRELTTKVEFHVGTGFTADDRARYFKNPPRYGKVKSFPIGVKDKPRHPVWLGPRDARDM